MAEQPATPAAPTPDQIAKEKAALGPNATTEAADPKSYYFEIADGVGGWRKVNAWGEEKGSAEDKKRFA
jgi:hypothetical protein